MLTVDLNIDEILSTYSDIADKLEERLNKAAQELAFMAHTHIVETVQQELKSTRETYLSALEGPTEAEEGVWEISIPKSVMWIEEGLPANFDMLPGFLASPKAKEGKDGKYLIIPFQHSKPSSQQTPFQKALTAEIKSEMRQRKIDKVQKGPDGKPKIGLVGKMNIDRPDVGRQEKGKPWGLGGPIKPSDEDKGPFLHGVNVYQKPKKGGGVKQEALTFRTASEKSPQKWKHPGLSAKLFLDKAGDWVASEWENTVLPSILAEFGVGNE